METGSNLWQKSVCCICELRWKKQHKNYSLFSSRFYRKTKLVGFQDMECVPCGDPPPPYEPHCESCPAHRGALGLCKSFLQLADGTQSLYTSGLEGAVFCQVSSRTESPFVVCLSQQTASTHRNLEGKYRHVATSVLFRLLYFSLDDASGNSS